MCICQCIFLSACVYERMLYINLWEGKLVVVFKTGHAPVFEVNKNSGNILWIEKRELCGKENMWAMTAKLYFNIYV